MAFVENLGECQPQKGVSPHEVRDVAGFVAMMQRLKDHSGLTYRELEERAALRGDALARSTLADVLRRTSLPRPEVLAAFVRACGDGERVDAWLATRDRLAAAGPDTAPVPASDFASEAQPQIQLPPLARPRRLSHRTAVGGFVLATTLLALVAWGLLPDDGDPSPASPSASSRTPVDGWVTIRPAGTPDLCLTDGRDRAGTYDSAVAVQLPCVHAPVPRTYLEPVGGGQYRIQWHHPEMGKGCLTVMGKDQIKGMLEPRQNCAQGTLFRLKPTAGTFQLRPATGSRCIGIVDNDTTAGAEAIEEPCAGTADQQFLIRAG
jgi:hypothetical protein